MMTFVRSKNDSYMVKRDTNQLKEKFWDNYSDYRLILWAWMLNDSSVIWATTDLSHSGYYIHSIVYIISIVVVGTPLVFSEICLAQYTNCDAISVWNFFPFFRCIGFGSIYLMVMKTVYMLVLTTWYMVYTAHSAMDPPPWGTCEEFNANITKCMVKKKNISVFQNCLEAQIMYGGDCGIKTASRCFFEHEIGNYVSEVWPSCLPRLKETVALWTIGIFLFILTFKRKFLRSGVKFALTSVSVLTFILICVALSTTGTWLSSAFSFVWANYKCDTFFLTLTRAFLSLGTGTGMITFLTRTVGFRSPANMTSLTVPMLSIFMTLMLSLITFSGIKTMSYYHGDEENVIEIGNNYFFSPFASMTEIISYFDEVNIWGLIWFTINFICMFVNTWLLFTYLKELIINNYQFARSHQKSSTIFLVVFLILLSYPFFCSDLTPALIDAIEIIQIFSSFILSISIYWIYGYYNHSVDIIFMIGVKSSYFWKFCWIVNPVLIFGILYTKGVFLAISEYETSYKIERLGITIDFLLFTILIGIYVFIILVTLGSHLFIYKRNDNFRGLFTPVDNWGPKDDILFKSRKMFVPEIMTTEFLYRQVKTHGISKKNKLNVMKESFTDSEARNYDQSTEWSILTSN